MKPTGDLLTRDRLVRGSQVAIGCLFIWAGLAKLGDPAAFAMQVHNFRLVPVALENLGAVVLPWIELIAGLALVAKVHARSGAAIATALMLMFTVAVIAALVRGLDIECGCFGTGDAATVGGTKILANIGMLALAAIGCLRPR